MFIDFLSEWSMRISLIAKWSLLFSFLTSPISKWSLFLHAVLLGVGEWWCKYSWNYHHWDCTGSHLRPAQYWVSPKGCSSYFLATTDVYSRSKTLFSEGGEFCQNWVLPFRTVGSFLAQSGSRNVIWELWPGMRGMGVLGLFLVLCFTVPELVSKLQDNILFILLSPSQAASFIAWSWGTDYASTSFAILASVSFSHTYPKSIGSDPNTAQELAQKLQFYLSNLFRSQNTLAYIGGTTQNSCSNCWGKQFPLGWVWSKYFLHENESNSAPFFFPLWQNSTKFQLQVSQSLCFPFPTDSLCATWLLLGHGEEIM